MESLRQKKDAYSDFIHDLTGKKNLNGVLFPQQDKKFQNNGRCFVVGQQRGKHWASA